MAWFLYRSTNPDILCRLEILPRSEQFGLYKYTPGKPGSLIPFLKAQRNPYPEANTLSSYFNKGQIASYINGYVAASYTGPQAYQSIGVGAGTSDSTDRLILDEFSTYCEK